MKRSFFAAIATALTTAFLLGGCATTGSIPATAQSKSAAAKPAPAPLPKEALSRNDAWNFLKGDIMQASQHVELTITDARAYMGPGEHQEIVDFCVTGLRDPLHGGRSITGCGYAYFLNRDGGWKLWLLYVPDAHNSWVLYRTWGSKPQHLYLPLPATK